MKRLHCLILHYDCDFEATGETMDEVKSKVIEHAYKKHGETVAQMSFQDKRSLLDNMNRMIKDDMISPV